MKKIFFTFLLLAGSTYAGAQMNFSASNTGVPVNFLTQELLAKSATEVFAFGAINNAGWSPKIYKSTNGGANWTNNTISGVDASQIMFISSCMADNKILMSTQDNLVTNTGVYASADGNTWTLSNSGMPANFLTLELLAKSGTEIFAFGAIYNAGWSPRIYKSINGGASWTNNVFSGVDASQSMFISSCVAGNKILLSTQDNAASNTAIYASVDGGSTWTLSDSGIPANFITQDLLAVSATEILAIGAAYNTGWAPGIYRSTNGGSSWSLVSVTGINASQEMYIASCMAGSRILMSTQNNDASNTGIYANSNSLSVENESLEEIQFFPNPVEDFLTIRTQGLKSVSIFNLKGQPVYSNEKPSFTDELIVDVSKYNHGMYYLKLDSETDSKFVKVIVQ